MKKIKLEASEDELLKVAEFTAKEWANGILSKFGSKKGRSFVIAFCGRAVSCVNDLVPEEESEGGVL